MPPTPPLSGFRIAIVDDHAIVREAMRWGLQALGAEIVFEGADGNEAVVGVLRHRPDLTLLDISMPNLNGISALRSVRAGWPEAKVAILSMHDDPVSVRDAKEAGAVGYLHKSAAFEQNAQQILLILKNEAEFATTVSSPAQAAASEVRKSEAPLSERQIEILQALVDGLTPVQIGRRLGISKNTVNNHLSAIYRRLKTANATQSIVAAARLGLIDISDSPRPATNDDADESSS